MDSEVRDLLEARGLRSLDEVFHWTEGECLSKPGLEPWRERWRLRLPCVRGMPAGTGPGTENSGRYRTYYLKRFDRPPLKRQWSRWLEGHWRISTAGVEGRNAEALAGAGIPAVKAPACGERMRGIWEVRSFVLLEEVAGQSLERWLPQEFPPPETEQDWCRRHRVIERLAELVAKFHRAGFIHRDLYLAHVFIEPDVPESSSCGPRFTLIDLQRVFRPRWRMRRWVVKDLAALHYSTPEDRVGRWDRLRFLCRYRKVCPQGRSVRALARAVDRKAERMRSRRPAPLAGQWTENPPRRRTCAPSPACSEPDEAKSERGR